METQDSFIDTLSDPILLRIFLLLNPTFCLFNLLRLVNRRWNRVATDLPIATKFRITLDKSDQKFIPMADYLEYFSRISPRIRQLYLRVDFMVFPNFLANFPFIPNLVWLDCSGSKELGSAELKILIKNCPNVRSVHLNRPQHELNNKIDDNCLGIIATDWQKLCKINISRCNRITNVGLINFVRVSSVRQINIGYISDVTNEVVAKLAQICGQSLLGIVLGGGQQLLTELAIISIAQNCRNLEKLIVNGSLCITDRSVQYLQHLHKLQKLDIYAHSADLSVLFKGQNMPMLRCLHFSNNNLTDDRINVIVDNCPRLQLLNLCANNSLVTDWGIEQILAKCSNLNVLGLEGLRLITGRNLLTIPERMPKLKGLGLNDQCVGISRETLDELSCLPGVKITWGDSE